MRKFFEQQSDALQLNESIRAHIATHGVGGVSFGHYRNPQKDVVYDVYMSSGWRTSTLRLRYCDNERVFEQLAFQEWLKHTDIRLLNAGAG